MLAALGRIIGLWFTQIALLAASFYLIATFAVSVVWFKLLNELTCPACKTRLLGGKRLNLLKALKNGKIEEVWLAPYRFYKSVLELNHFQCLSCGAERLIPEELG